MKDDIEKLIAQGEGQNVEFKASLRVKDEIGQTISAFANSKPVNPVLCQLMYDMGFIEKYGSGIKMMKRLCREWGNREPYYELHPVETKVIFESPIKEATYIDISDISERLNERQKKGLFYAVRKGSITRKEYMNLNKVSVRTAYEELKDLTDKGFLKIEGKGRGVRYLPRK